MDRISFTIEKHIGVLTTHPSGWRKEINIVSWNGEEPRYDIREWDESHTRMSKGIRLTEDEFAKLVRFGSIELEEVSK